VSRGRFITLEGGEGVGKSTQVKALAEALHGRGIDVLVTREPGGSEGAEKIRELLLGGSEDRWGARSEALLFAAARADHVDKVVRPALENGRWVLSDRFVDSSLAYQGGAGGLGIETIREINAFGIHGEYPDRTLVLVSDEGSGRARERDSGASDRIGGRPDDYHRKVEAAFRIIAAEEPERVQLIDASGSPEDVTKRLLSAISDLIS
jgi:dTMP kinase